MVHRQPPTWPPCWTPTPTRSWSAYVPGSRVFTYVVGMLLQRSAWRCLPGRRSQKAPVLLAFHRQSGSDLPEHIDIAPHNERAATHVIPHIVQGSVIHPAVDGGASDTQLLR